MNIAKTLTALFYLPREVMFYTAFITCEIEEVKYVSHVICLSVSL